MPTMKKMRYAYPDCEHDGDVQYGEELVAEALTKIGSQGKVTDAKWSGEDGDSAYIYFTCEENKLDAFRKTIDELV